MNIILPRAIYRAKQIITISANSKKELIDLFPKIETKTQVVYHGIESVFFNAPSWQNTELATLTKKHLPPKYILYVGGDSIKKQAKFAVEIFATALHKKSNIFLYMIGISNKGSEQIKRLALQLDIQNRVAILPTVSDKALASLYKNAIATIYPTLHEGFGFPIIEALATGQNILASNTASLPEISNGFATLIPTRNKSAWVSKLKDTVLNQEHTQSEKSKRQQYASGFNWSECAKKTYNIFRETIKM